MAVGVSSTWLVFLASSSVQVMLPTRIYATSLVLIMAVHFFLRIVIYIQLKVAYAQKGKRLVLQMTTKGVAIYIYFEEITTCKHFSWQEYFSTGDVQVAATDLKDPDTSEYHPYFVKRLVSMAMDRHDKEKEMASVLLSALYADVISSVHISQGFVLLLEAADDLVIDILDAVGVLALFVARAVVDDILPPAFLSRATKVLPESSKGVQVIQTSEKSYLSAPHHAEFVECIDLSV